MTMPVRTMRWLADQDPEALLTREWLVTNGRGGYASGSIAGVPTRRFHGLLVASLPTPLGRTMMFNDVVEQVKFRDGRCVPLSGTLLEEGTQLQRNREYMDFHDPARADFRAAVASGAISGGMIPKLEESFAVLAAGAGSVVIVGRLAPGDLRRAVLDPGSVGTVLVA